MIRSFSLPAIFVSTVLLAGCGGSSSNSSSNSSSSQSAGASGTARATFIAKADALCKSTHDHQSVLRRQARGLTIAKLPPVLYKQAAIANNLAGQLRALKVPAGDGLPVGRFIDAVKLLGTLSTAAANSIKANHARAVAGLKVKLDFARQHETALGQGYGFKVCATGASF